MNINRLIYLLVFVFLFAVSCNDDNNDLTPDAGGTDFGRVTSAMILVNPIINEGTSTTLPASGTLRGGLILVQETLVL